MNNLDKFLQSEVRIKWTDKYDMSGVQRLPVSVLCNNAEELHKIAKEHEWVEYDMVDNEPFVS